MITEYTDFCLSGGWDDGPGLCKRGQQKKVKLRVASAISESGLTSRTSSSCCPHFYFPCLSHLLIFDLMVLSQYGLGLMFVDSVFKIIPDLLTTHTSTPLFFTGHCLFLLLPFNSHTSDSMLESFSYTWPLLPLKGRGGLTPSMEPW